MILNLQSADAELSKRLIDFASGLTYALNGGMQRVADKVFLLTAAQRRGLRRRARAASRATATTRPKRVGDTVSRARYQLECGTAEECHHFAERPARHSLTG